MLIAYNQDTSCTDTTLRTLSVFNGEEGVYTPSAFSPNNDGSNDVFRVYASGVMKEITLEIYNRWGEVVFETTDITIGWDGTYKGKQQDIETYVYTVRALMFNDEIITKKGNINLLR